MPEREKPLPELRDALRAATAKVEPAHIWAPEGTGSRMEDIWQPLLAIARAAGPVWEQRAVDAINDLRATWEMPEPPAFALLRRVAGAVRLWKDPTISREELWNRLPAAARPKTQPDMTKQLRQAGLKIGTVRRGEDVKRGYRVDVIQEAASKLPVPAE